MEKFMAEYARQLAQALISHPDEYVWESADLPEVLERMRAALRAGSYNKDSRAMRATCKALGIQHTYRAINNFLRDFR